MSELLIVGAGPGLGRAIASRFAKEGMSVALVARTKRTLDLLAGELAAEGVRVSSVQADAGEPDELKAAVEAVTAGESLPEVVVYNAGLIQADSLGDLSAEQLTQAWSVNVLGAVLSAAATIPRMAERGSGTFLITGGVPVPIPTYLSLSLGKAGVRALATMLADQYGPRGIHAATITVAAEIVPGTAYDPDRIAEHYWRLHAQPRDQWETEFVFDGVT